MKKLTLIFIGLFWMQLGITQQQEHSVARQWNEILLEAIRNDFARPTVHARNLYHISAAMYDAWAVYDRRARTVFFERNTGTSFIRVEDAEAAQKEAINYVAYRLIKHRFKSSPGEEETFHLADSLFLHLGGDPGYVDNYYYRGSAALGNYIANQMIQFGLTDGSNEQNGYANRYYRPRNPAIAPELPGNRFFFDQNRWQPITFRVFIDQSGNPFPGGAPEFLSPEWGNVTPFALQEEDLTTYTRNGFDYKVYHDPGAPCYIDTRNGGGLSNEYKWGFTLVSKWGAHLDPKDSVIWDISPASIGNIPVEDLPTNIEDYRAFYQVEGGDISRGHILNPHTGKPYEPQYVPRGDYARVLAEFWADGPDSETPPGHWYSILNYVSDHPDFEKRYRGEGRVLSNLEWDVKSYLMLGGAMHDCAISAWGVKGWYDYPRPVSTIRWMGVQGQSTIDTLPSYSINGLQLEEGYVELVMEGDSLAGENNEHVGKIKLYTWRGPDYIESPDTSVAGVDWILAENWWPYQRPTFVTPPFAGYVSGHSTYSRAAAELMTLLTGDEFFPGGMGTFPVKKNKFLVFEDGPSQDFELQWATYRDASDQTSLSRIWGGIHPPVDDIPGRLMGIEIGVDAFNYAETFFNLDSVFIDDNPRPDTLAEIETFSMSITPNPVQVGQLVHINIDENLGENLELQLFDLNGRLLRTEKILLADNRRWRIREQAGVYLFKLLGEKGHTVRKLMVVE
ncbi:MAG: DUF6851 domain-containing protein [Bacteroidota bacterium]